MGGGHEIGRVLTDMQNDTTGERQRVAKKLGSMSLSEGGMVG